MSNRLVPMLALIVAAGIFFGYARPAWTGSIATTQGEIDSYNRALASAAEYETRQDELLRAQNALPAEKLARLNNFLPDGVNNVELILDLDALAASSGVALSNFDIQSAQSNGGAGAAGRPSAGAAIALAESPVDSLQISLTATATYDAFRAFLRGIEASERILDVTSLQVAPSTTGVYNYSLTLRLYWLR